jgi:hypothetical protein
LKRKIISCFLIACLVACLDMNLFVTQADADDSSDFWLTVASNAWRFFQPGVGVDSTTGLPENGVGSSFFTDWDAGVYIQAVIDAQKLGLIGHEGAWGFDARIDKFLSFLEKRPLMADGYPYLAYNSATGKNANNVMQVATDAGCLFVSLKNLEEAEPALKARIDNIVYNLTNYERGRAAVDGLLGETQNGTRLPDIYDYYVISGFAGFWPERFSTEAASILKVIVSEPAVNYQGVSLPSAKINCEPLLMSIFNLKSPDPNVVALSKQTYLAQEARYNQTGKYTAFTEGFSNFGFVYEWVVLPDGRTWMVQTSDQNYVYTDVGVTPIVYLKAAVGFLAVYTTAYPQNMFNSLLKQIPATQYGYLAGVDEKGRAILSVDFGNGLIVSAARYGIINKVTVNLQYPNASPTASPSPLPNTPAPTAQKSIAPNPLFPMNISDAPLSSSEPSASVPQKEDKNGCGNQTVDVVRLCVFSLAVFCVLVAAVLVAGYWSARKRASVANARK